MERISHLSSRSKKNKCVKLWENRFLDHFVKILSYFEQSFWFYVGFGNMLENLIHHFPGLVTVRYADPLSIVNLFDTTFQSLDHKQMNLFQAHLCSYFQKLVP